MYNLRVEYSTVSGGHLFFWREPGLMGHVNLSMVDVQNVMRTIEQDEIKYYENIKKGEEENG